MSRNDDARPTRNGMTPSGWHDDAMRNRDAGHDEMQAAEWRRAKDACHSPITHQGKTFFFVNAWVEKPFILAGRVIGFADVGLLYESQETEKEKEWRLKVPPSRPYKPDRWWVFLEVKPRILSVGAVIRQCIATEYTAERAGLSCEVWAAVYKDDPKTALLIEMGRVVVLLVERPTVQP